MITRLKRVISIYVLASALWTTVAGCQHYFGTAHAATYYVATTGNNTNPGTEDKPFLTIAHAVDTMVAGDTTYVRGGTYNEPGVRFRRSGTSSSPIQLLNYPGESPVLACTSKALESNSFLFMNGTSYRLAIGWITLEGFEVTDCYNGIKAYNIHDSRVRRMRIHHNVSAGMLTVGGLRVVVDRNISYSNGSTTTPNHNFYLGGNDFIVTNNVIYDSYNYGIQQNGYQAYSSSLHAGPEFAGAANWVVANNTFAYARNQSGYVVWGSQCHNTRIENNIFFQNGVNKSSHQPNGVTFIQATASTGVTIINNHAYATTGALQFVGGSHHASTVFSDNSVNVSPPGFVNAPATLPASPNFALTGRSPLIDKGLSYEQSPDIDKGLRLSTTRVDFDGTTRPQGRAYDIGAYEYRANGDSQSPKAPIALQAH